MSVLPPGTEREARFRVLFEHSRDAVRVTREGIHLFANPACIALFGLPPGTDLAGRPILDFIAPARRPQMADHLRRRIAGEKVATFHETCGLRVDGSEFDLEIRVTIYQEDGIEYVLAILRDVTAERNDQEWTQRLVERMELATSAAHLGIWDWDVGRNELVWDDRMYELYGLRQGDFAGAYEAWLSGVHPEDRASTDTLVQQAISGVREYDTEFRVVRPDGAVRVLKAHGVVIRDEAGVAVRMTGVNFDVTESRRVEDALNASVAEYSALFEHMNSGFAYHQVVLDERGAPVDYVFLEINKAYEEHTGLTREIIGKRVTQVHPGIERADPDFIGIYGRVALTGEAVQFDVYFEPQRHWYAISAYCPKKGHFVTIFDDITVRKNLEAHLQQSQKMEAIGQLAGGVAHDFNNILNVILGYCELLRRKFAHDDQAQSCIHEIVTAGRRAADLTGRLLSYSRKQQLHLQPLDLNTTIEQVARLLRRVIGESIELNLDLAPDELTVKADRSHLEQVIMNLATNARDAMPAGGALRIATFVSADGPEVFPEGVKGSGGSYAGIRVTDTGAGMEESVRARVFDPFFTTKAVDRGTGLGLAICYGIVRQHDGFIGVRSTPGEGTTFEILLPLLEPPAGAVAPAGIVAPVIAPADAPEGTETLLVVEDDPHVRKFMALLLSDAGYRVLEAGDGDQALRVFNEHAGEIRLVVMDVIMPKRNGNDVLLLLRKTRPQLATVFVSGYSADLLAESVLEQTTTAFLRKPVNPLDLLAEVRRLLERGMDASPTT